MYEVISKDSGRRIALCEQLRYVKINPYSGVYVQCEAEQAEGIAVNGVIYSLHDQVIINKLDIGPILASAEQQAKELLHIKAALCELDLAGGE